MTPCPKAKRRQPDQQQRVSGRVCKAAPAGAEGGTGQSYCQLCPRPLAPCLIVGPSHTRPTSLGVQTGGSTRSQLGSGSLGGASAGASSELPRGLVPAGTAPHASTAGTAPAPGTPCVPASGCPGPCRWPPLAARTLQTDVIGVLPVIEQGRVIPKEFGISPTFVAPHGAHRGGRVQGRLRLCQLGARHQVAELHLGFLWHSCFSKGLPVGLGLCAQLGGRWPQRILLGLLHVWKEKGGCHWPCHPSSGVAWSGDRSALQTRGGGEAGCPWLGGTRWSPLLPLGKETPVTRCKGKGATEPRQRHRCQPQHHRLCPHCPYPRRCSPETGPPQTPSGRPPPAWCPSARNW